MSKKFKVEMTYRTKVGRNSTTKDFVKMVETDDIRKWVRDNGIGTAFTYFYGKENAWLHRATEITDADEYLELGVKLNTLFSGDFVLRKISRKAVADAKKKYDEAEAAWSAALNGVVVGEQERGKGNEDQRVQFEKGDS